ncbi:MAG: metallophosphoesterase family protein [Polyangiaceae bacterium]|nr:metallophosphoesterase family protein [Polyangiaceae bacterium]
MRILCISDIHGHADALIDVLAFGKSQGCTVTLAAGDHCFSGPRPLDTWKLLTGVNAHCTQGIGDWAITSVDPDDIPVSCPHEEARVQRLREVQQELGEDILEQIARLPKTFHMSLEDGGELMLVHGSPMDPTTSITHDMTDDEVRMLLGDADIDVLVCGGAHVPFERILDSTHIVAVGSVGESPTVGFAQAAILDTSNAGVSVRLIQLDLRGSDSTKQSTSNP